MRSINKFPFVIFVLIIFIAAGANIQQKPEWKGKIEYENGVKVIKSPKEPMYGEITFDLEEDLTIGNEEDENYMFYRSIDIEIDTEENILVLDRGNCRIQKYDMNGDFLQTIGRKGQGPGEFERPGNLYLDNEDNIYVLESGVEIHAFNKVGEFRKTIKFADFARFISSEFGITKGQNIIGKTNSRGERRSNIPMDHETFLNIDIINPLGKTVKTIASYRWEMPPPIKYGGGLKFLNNLFTPFLYLCQLNEELMIYGYSSEYRLFAINPSGEMAYVIEKDEPLQPVRKEEKDKVIDRFMDNQKKRKGGPKLSRGKVEKALKFPKYKPFYNWIIKDDKDRIYVSKFKFPLVRNNVFNYDVFSKEGYYLYRINLPFSSPTIKNGYIYSVESDQETGIIKVKRYKIKNWDEMKVE